MLYENPKQLTHQEVIDMCNEAKGKIDTIYLHWTAGRYDQCFAAYHFNIGRDGQVYKTCEALTDTLSHTWHRNERAIGVTLCCALDAVLYQHYVDFGTVPPTALQLDKMAMLVAILTRHLNLPISGKTVMTHAEAAVKDGYGPHSTDRDKRWDLFVLPSYGAPVSGKLRLCNMRFAGPILRERAEWYRTMFDERMRARQEQELLMAQAESCA